MNTYPQMSESDTEKSIRYVKDIIKLWVEQANGWFNLFDIYRDINPQSLHERILIIQCLESMVELGKLDNDENRRGRYRRKNIELDVMDLHSPKGNPLPIFLPFMLHKQVNIYPGNIIIVAGEPDSGKTAFALNCIFPNQDDFEIHYFNSEMGEDEFKVRLSNFTDMSLDMFKFTAYERSGDFHDVVRMGVGKLNIIDFLEIHDEFWLVGKYIRQIHDALNGAVAIICLQKNPGTAAGIGGYRTLEKARLYLNMRPGTIEIKKAKNWVDPKDNPNGKCMDYKLVRGCELYPDPFRWYKEQR